MGGRMRMILSEVDVVKADRPLTKLPVARAVWIPRPDFKRSCEAWILAGGAHHTSFSLALTAEHLRDFAAMAGIEFIRIGTGTDIPSLENELRWNDAAYKFLT
jgi:L-arabinose isomerase